MIIRIVRALRALFGNPASKRLLRSTLQKCRSCGQKKLRTALDRYVGVGKKHICISCGFFSLAISAILDSATKIFGVNKSEMIKFFRDPVKKQGLLSVLEGIKEYGITLPQIIGAPFLIVWDYTHGCNLSCKHCYASAGRSLSDELSTEEAIDLVDDLAELGVVAIAFSGGEPLVREDFLDVAEHAAKQNMYVALATNGTLIDEDLATRLKEVGVRYVEISLDGASAETHDGFRGVEGAFDQAVQGVEACVDADIMTAVATTATQENLKDVPKIIRLARDIGVDRFIEFNFIPTGRGKFIIDKDLNPQQRETLLKELYEELKKGGIEIFSTAPQFARIAIQEYEKAEEGAYVPFTFYGGKMGGRTITLAEFISGCGAGRIYAAIEPNGDVQPCVFMPIKVGNIREEQFKKIWHDSKVLRDLRDRSKLKGTCSKCKYKYVCGGCRSRAYGYFNDYLMPDPGCKHNKKLYEAFKTSSSKRGS